MTVRLEREDFTRLVSVLRDLPDFANVRDRRRLVEAALEGVPRGADLLMTNHHVIRSRQQAEAAEYDFNYQLDRDGKPCPVTTVSARAGGLFHTQPELDYTVVQLAEPPAFGLPLRLRAAVLPRDARVAIIQHPGGHFKKISLQNNFVAYADNRVVQYFTSTEPGSSGSPVFDDDFAVVAIHHSGGMLEEPGSGRRYLRNAGTSMGAVLADLRQAARTPPTATTIPRTSATTTSASG